MAGVNTEQKSPGFIGPPTPVVIGGCFRQTMQQAAVPNDADGLAASPSGEVHTNGSAGTKVRSVQREEEREKLQMESTGATVIDGRSCILQTLPSEATVTTGDSDFRSQSGSEVWEIGGLRAEKSDLNDRVAWDLGKSEAEYTQKVSKHGNGDIKPKEESPTPDAQNVGLLLAPFRNSVAAAVDPSFSDPATESTLVKKVQAQAPPSKSESGPDQIAQRSPEEAAATHPYSLSRRVDLSPARATDDSNPTTAATGTADNSEAGVKSKNPQSETMRASINALGLEEASGERSAALPSGPTQPTDASVPGVSKRDFGNSTRTATRLKDPQMPAAEPANSSPRNGEKRNEDHDASQQAANAKAVEAAVHAFVDTNHHVESVSAPPLAVADVTHSGVPREGGAQADTPASLSKPPGGADAQPASVTPFPTTVNAARLVERLKESEINLSLRSADLGDVSIHTAISHERLSAQISLERSDLSKVIASEVSALQSKLSQEHGILATIDVQQQGQSFPSHGGQSQPQPMPSPVRPAIQREDQSSTVTTSTDIAEGRLDIRV